MVEAGSLTRAAELLNIAQPALSQQLAALEDQLGKKLLERTRQGVVPTAAGEALYRHANLILKQINNAIAEVGASTEEISGRVSIGMPLSVTAVLIVPLTQLVAKRYPSISLDFTDGLPADLAAEFVVNGRFDMAFVPMLMENDALDQRALLLERLTFMTSPKNPLSQPDVPITLADVSETQLVLPNRAVHLRQTIDAALLSIGAQPKVIAEMNSVFALCAAAAAGLGSTIVPLVTSLRANPERLVSRPIIEPQIERPLYLVTANRAPLSSQAAAVHSVVDDLVVELIANGKWVGARSAS